MPAQIQSIRTLFEQALELSSPSERQAFLDQECAEQPQIRAQVEALLGAYASASDFLEAPAGDLQGIWDEIHDTRTSRDTHAAGGNAAPFRLNFLDPPRQSDHLGRLGHYEILEVVGHGGMGVVLKALDEKLQRVVAIKALAPAWSASVAARKRFVREAQSAAAVSHDHLVPIYAVEDSGPVPYFVMQYVAGESLQQRIDREGFLSLDEVVRIGVQIAEGLAAAHRQGLVHRDIKPGNILLEEGTGRVKITDFGLARAVDDARLSREGMIAGTPEYMSPEQARGAALDHRADFFSLGSVLYAMCTGCSPFRAESSLVVLRRICDDTPQDVRQLRPDVPAALIDLIARLHAKNPADRPSSAEEVRSCLSHPTPVAPARGTSRRRWLLTAGSAAAIVSLGLWLSWLRRRSPEQSWLEPTRSPVLPPRPEPEATPEVVNANRRRWQPRALLIIAARDFYYPEYGPVRNILELNGIECRVTSTTLEECRPNSESPQIAVTPELLLAEAKAADYDAIYFCGGPGCLEYAEGGKGSAEAQRLIREALAAKCTVAAMGIGVVILAEADVLADRQAACYPWGKPPGVYARRIAARGAHCKEDPVIEDGLFLTGRAPQDVKLFSASLVKRLGIEPRLPTVAAPNN